MVGLDYSNSTHIVEKYHSAANTAYQQAVEREDSNEVHFRYLLPCFPAGTSCCWASSLDMILGYGLDRFR